MFAAININKADVKTLTSLKGIGKVKAEAIVNYRKQHPFNSINDLIKVKGIGIKLFTKIKSNIVVDSSKK
jgi:competence protein ComEA